MGLDMYLEARKYIEKVDWSQVERDGYDNMKPTEQWSDVVSSAGLSKLASKDIYGAHVAVNVAYWRKSNQIHKWFVDNVQNGEDNCGEYYVSIDKLKELLTTCQQALFSKDPSLLPPQAGFFFGSYDIDEWYWNGIKDTIKQLKRILEMSDLSKVSFYYSSSW
jgi:hypothetical protein